MHRQDELIYMWTVTPNHIGPCVPCGLIFAHTVLERCQAGWNRRRRWVDRKGVRYGPFCSLGHCGGAFDLWGVDACLHTVLILRPWEGKRQEQLTHHESLARITIFSAVCGNLLGSCVSPGGQSRRERSPPPTPTSPWDSWNHVWRLSGLWKKGWGKETSETAEAIRFFC